jgi:hypothetical protein
MRSKLRGIAIVLVLVAAACGGGTEPVTDAPGASVATDGSPTADAPGDDPASSGGSDDAAPSDGTGGSDGAGGSDGQDAAASYFDGALTQGYLQGNWCDSQGLSWVFSAGDFQVGPDQDTLGLAAPIENAFSEPGATFISRTDNEFAIEQLGQQITFTRGGCSGASGDALGSGPDLSGLDICELFNGSKDELAGLAGFQADPGPLSAADGVYEGAQCLIKGGGNNSVEVLVFGESAVTLQMAVGGLEGVSSVSGFGSDAVYIETANDQVDGPNAVMFSIGAALVRVEAVTGAVSIPRDDLIRVAQLADQLLRGAAS